MLSAQFDGEGGEAGMQFEKPVHTIFPWMIYSGIFYGYFFPLLQKQQQLSFNESNMWSCNQQMREKWEKEVFWLCPVIVETKYC